MRDKTTKVDVIVLGAGIVGISTALHLQSHGRAVVLIDRREPAGETSFGNAGIIQREGIYRYAFPRNWSKIRDHITNRTAQTNLHWIDLPWLAPSLFNYWRNSVPSLVEHSAKAMWALTDGSLDEHNIFALESDTSQLIRRTGYLKLYRNNDSLDSAILVEETSRKHLGTTFTFLDKNGIFSLEPGLSGDFAGGIFLQEHISVSDPGALCTAYAALFTRRGGLFLTGDAFALTSVSGGWRINTDNRSVFANNAVVAMGPWSGEILSILGIKVPLAFKRGYHMHFGAARTAKLNRPVVDVTHGYVLSDMTRGIRLTTGVEFALRDSQATPVQLERVEPIARKLFPLGARLDPKPWLGSRPFFPDLLPMIGPVQGHNGLWANFGHHHLGLTTGPTSGRLLAEMMTGSSKYTDPTPYRIDRFE